MKTTQKYILVLMLLSIGVLSFYPITAQADEGPVADPFPSGKFGLSGTYEIEYFEDASKTDPWDDYVSGSQLGGGGGGVDPVVGFGDTIHIRVTIDGEGAFTPISLRIQDGINTGVTVFLGTTDANGDLTAQASYTGRVSDADPCHTIPLKLSGDGVHFDGNIIDHFAVGNCAPGVPDFGLTGGAGAAIVAGAAFGMFMLLRGRFGQPALA